PDVGTRRLTDVLPHLVVLHADEEQCSRDPQGSATVGGVTVLQELADAACHPGGLPGAVALVSRHDQVEVACAGVRTIGGEPMTRDTVFRVASITKPITAAAAMVLVERGWLRLDDPVAGLLPELGSPSVLRSVDGPVDDPDNLEPAKRAI